MTTYRSGDTASQQFFLAFVIVDDGAKFGLDSRRRGHNNVGKAKSAVSRSISKEKGIKKYPHGPMQVMYVDFR